MRTMELPENNSHIVTWLLFGLANIFAYISNHIYASLSNPYFELIVVMVGKSIPIISCYFMYVIHKHKIERDFLSRWGLLKKISNSIHVFNWIKINRKLLMWIALFWIAIAALITMVIYMTL